MTDTSDFQLGLTLSDRLNFMSGVFRGTAIRERVTPGDVNNLAEARRVALDFLKATSDDAKAVLADIASALRHAHAYPLSEDGTAILVDTAEPGTNDGSGRTYYLTLTEIPR